MTPPRRICQLNVSEKSVTELLAAKNPLRLVNHELRQIVPLHETGKAGAALHTPVQVK
jgi:hypothetical protein